MLKKIMTMLSLGLSLISCASQQTIHPIVMSDNTKEKINQIINSEIKPNQSLSQGDLLSRISAKFLETPYLANTLIGDREQQEVLVVNFEGVDCFTYLDYVLALSQSEDESSFLSELAKVRYKNAEVNYFHRKHFFTDWFAEYPKNAVDVTSTLTLNTITINKKLNRKSDGNEYIKGLGVIPRKITYIPGSLITQSVVNNLQEGDFVGVYTPIDGLDVSHTGLVIKKNGEVFYRNASSLSKNKKVVDTPFIEYMRLKPGIIVLRQ
ncbi:DUF1460 domain-containing protein [Providencia alcalifaciens]|uniref:DUF1460 domain-containing protein n=1 Tax=Providencia alcalifaciens TaxID=126385 RepID=UPI001CC6D5FE|nr:DUF1460 domain-containing protein [Providencia alcalifaciens]CAG9436710.1 hypothetical protein NVI2019_KOLGMIGM_04067 [Providencia alcalifaciens]CAG9436719.1 hypothetical protein NVI2019_PLFLNFOB_04065 [Providencia alcalifaciens]CAG9436743.1 hypothetical protein NVI2019_ANGEOOBF_04066 [Providencia alcalifaciens]CAG9437575.1 hypothetical protein NVI2019_OHEONHNH_04065 [Providencia alcalifaciens]